MRIGMIDWGTRMRGGGGCGWIMGGMGRGVCVEEVRERRA